MTAALIILALGLGIGVYLGRKSSDGPGVFDVGPTPKLLDAEADAIDARNIQEEIVAEEKRQVDRKVQLDAAEADLHAKGLASTRVGKNVIPQEQELTKEQEFKRFQAWVAKNMPKKPAGEP